jgi:hypothetical protein
MRTCSHPPLARLRELFEPREPGRWNWTLIGMGRQKLMMIRQETRVTLVNLARFQATIRAETSLPSHLGRFTGHPWFGRKMYVSVGWEASAPLKKLWFARLYSVWYIYYMVPFLSGYFKHSVSYKWSAKVSL